MKDFLIDSIYITFIVVLCFAIALLPKSEIVVNILAVLEVVLWLQVVLLLCQCLLSTREKERLKEATRNQKIGPINQRGMEAYKRNIENAEITLGSLLLVIKVTDIASIVKQGLRISLYIVYMTFYGDISLLIAGLLYELLAETLVLIKEQFKTEVEKAKKLQNSMVT